MFLLFFILLHVGFGCVLESMLSFMENIKWRLERIDKDVNIIDFAVYLFGLFGSYGGGVREIGNIWAYLRKISTGLEEI